MPYLSIQTNRVLPDEKQTELLGAALKIVATQLGKPESYVMVSFCSGSTYSLRRRGEPFGFSGVTKYRDSRFEAKLTQFGPD
jgi:phenylpyruvate tautomerase